MKPITAILLLALATSAHAATTSANHGHHGGLGNGAIGSAGPGAGATSSAAAGQSGNGSSYGDWYLRTSAVDNYQPWPQSEVHQFQKPQWTPYAGK